MTIKITAATKPIAQVIDDMNISYSLYDTGDGEAAYLMRDEDINEMITRVNGAIEVITLRYEIDIERIKVRRQTEESTVKRIDFAGHDASPSSSTYCPNPDTCEEFPHCSHIVEESSI